MSLCPKREPLRFILFALFVVTVVLLMTACTPFHRPSPEIQYVTVPCKTQPVERPAFEFQKVRPEDPLNLKVKSLLIEREQRQQYEGKLEASLSACK